MESADEKSMTTFHSSTHEDDGDVEDDEEDGRSHVSSVSRLSISTTRTKQWDQEVEEDSAILMAHMSQLSLQNNSEVEGEEELWDSDRESGWNSVPTMRQRRKEEWWGSEGEGMGKRMMRRKEAMREREKWLEKVWGMRSRRREGVSVGSGAGEVDEMDESVESECVVIAKPKGGERALCMDMDEMKACEDLGFELQAEWTLELPRGMSVSSIDTDTSINSSLANFRISSPGDDPKDVKARLKMWAQAVASAIRLTS